MKKVIFTLTVALATGMATLNAQNVNIPDANFKAYLVGNGLINTNADTEIQVSEAQAFTGMIYCPSLNISDLTGIEAFTSLTSLHCYQNQISTVDISNNPLIETLVFYYNNVSILNISNNSLLENLDCSNNPISSIDLTNKPNLKYLTCFGSQLTSLDLSNNPVLEYLFCSNNQLTSLDISNNLSLTELYCNVNQLTSLDVSILPNLIEFSCEDNALTSLNVKNGNNNNFTTFLAYGNPNLICIEVDNAVYSTANWTNIDAQTTFSEDCSGTTSVEDIFGAINSIHIYPNPANDFVTISNMPIGSTVRVLDVTGKVVYSSKITSEQTTINTADFTNGIYLIRIDNNGNIANRKLVVNK